MPRSPTPSASAELREHSRYYREAAEKTADAAIKRELAAHAEALAQIAEAIERVVEVVESEGDAAQSEKIQPYVQRIISALLRDQQVTPAAQGQIKAWRMRAEELRATAEEFGIPSVQEVLRRAAANYDQLAVDAEALLTGCRPVTDDSQRTITRTGDGG